MSLAIMQPYLFPFIGYFQLVSAVDLFVFYDDVNYINRGWINRNRILSNNKDQLFTISCNNASQNKLIKDIFKLNDHKETSKLLMNFQNNYKKASYFEEVYPLIEKILLEKTETISELAIKSVKEISNFLNIKTEYKISSKTYDNRQLKKADRLIDICHLENEKTYINASGGKEIYDKDYFKNKGIDLKFLIPIDYKYKQFNENFIPWLSIIDVLMFNSKEDIKNKILPSYSLD